jgi:predicted O-linked N-acetylglucosamine transferase (SPINDLY family)/SAM-dependent methyltransferase
MSLSLQLADQPEVQLTPAQFLSIALELHHTRQFEKAREIYLRLLADDPAHHVALHHLGLIAHQTGDHAAAVDLIRQAIAIKPDYFEAYSNLTAILRIMRRPQDAIEAGSQAIDINPNYAQAYSNLGNAYEDLDDIENALAFYQKAVALEPNFVEAQTNAANILRRMGRCEEALAVCEDIILRRPDAPDPYFYLGNILRELCRPGEAITAYRHALALRPHFADVYINLGNVFLHQTKLDEAAEAYRQAIALRPEMVEAHCNLGAVLETQGKVAEAIAAYQTALHFDPSLFGARIELHHQRRYACDWTGIETEERELLAALAKHNRPTPPFGLLSMHVRPEEQLRVGQLWAQCFEIYKGRRFDHTHRRRPKDPSQRVKIGYLSGDFHRHATAHLMVELFERHDRHRFEFIAYSHGFDDQSEMRWRLRKAFDRFVDIKDLNYAEAAQVIFDDGIDILIELKGYTQHARNEIASMRPAPVQVSYIGYPGTMGTDFIDYIIADPFVLPFDQQPFYSEKIVHLPHCYQPNDTRRRIADQTPSRTACCLPENGFVFCCFNNTYKLTPKIFAVWMRLLNALPNAVLWLLDGNALAKDNLRREAAARGVDPDRLVFAPKVPSAEHLARQRLADLFLDTLPYNAHTTASDALWAGLPVLTCAGQTFAGRVAGSLLHAVGLPELVTHSLEDYETLALRLANEPMTLFALRQKLLAQKLSAPLFDITRITRDLETAYMRMWDTWTSGAEAEPFAVEPADTDASGQVVFLKEPPRFSRIAYQSCPLCGSLDIPQMLGADCTKHPLYKPGLPATMTWHQCGDCQHVFTGGYFGEDALAAIFGDTHQGQTVGHDMERQRAVSARMVERVARFASSGDWLDVGFGNGSLLFTADEWGFRPVGIDLRKDNVQALKNLGYEAHCIDLDAMLPDGRFTVISMADVLEHMPFPKTGLKAAHRLLRPGGILFLSMPNMDTMIWKLLHANGVNPYWGEIEHYHNFSRKRLYALLAENGFRAVEYQISERYRACMEVIAVKA